MMPKCGNQVIKFHNIFLVLWNATKDSWCYFWGDLSITRLSEFTLRIISYAYQHPILSSADAITLFESYYLSYGVALSLGLSDTFDTTFTGWIRKSHMIQSRSKTWKTNYNPSLYFWSYVVISRRGNQTINLHCIFWS